MTDEPIVLGRELLASVVVFLVALPLCMGIAIASGVPPALGLITGIVGGLVVGCVSGAPLLVSGPAAGLAVLVWQAVQEHGVERLGIIVLGAGVLQVICGIGKFGRWFRAVSPAIIQGMLAGIGVLILSSQFHVMVDDVPRDAGWKNLISIPEAIYKGVVPNSGTPMHHLAAAIGLSTLIVLIVWSVVPKPAALRPIPGALVAVVVATIATAVLGWNIKHVEVPASLFDAVTVPSLTSLRGALDVSVIGQMVAFAIIASAETLLSAGAVDRLHGGRPSNFDRELTAQGIGNTLCGLMGALPMTGVIVRSTANVESGARTRLSTIMHGAFLLAFVVALPHVLSMIPIASLAAILVYTGYKLVNVKTMRELRRAGTGELVVYLVTLVGIVATDLLTGVLLGFGAAVLKLVWHFTRLEVHVEHTPDGSRSDVRLVGAATFVQLPRLAAALEALPRDREVHVHLDSTVYIDHSTLDLLRNFERVCREAGGKVEVDWQQSDVKSDSEAIARAGRVVASRPKASPLAGSAGASARLR